MFQIWTVVDGHVICLLELYSYSEEEDFQKNHLCFVKERKGQGGDAFVLVVDVRSGTGSLSVDDLVCCFIWFVLWCVCC